MPNSGMTSPAQLLRLMFFTALIAVTGVVIFLMHTALSDPVKRYLKEGHIVSDAETAKLFELFVKEELPPSAQSFLNFAGRRSGAAAVYVLRQDPEHHFRLQPLNAAYDSSRDAIFVDQQLIELVKNSPRGTTGRRTLVAFILLHELGHRGADPVAFVPDHGDEVSGLQCARRPKGMSEHRAPAETVQNLRGLRPHPGSCSGCQDNDRGLHLHVAPSTRSAYARNCRVRTGARRLPENGPRSAARTRT